MDAIRIQIIRDCDEQGQNGTVADDAYAILPAVGGVSLLDGTLAAFADSYGIHQVADGNGDLQDVTLERNLSYRIRQFATTIFRGYTKKLKRSAADVEADQEADAAEAAVVIVDGVAT